MSALFTDPGTDPFHRPWPFEGRQVKDWNEYPERAEDGITFDVAGAPGAQGSKKAWLNKATGHVQMTEQNKARVEPWRSAVAAGAARAIEMLGDRARYPLAGPVAVEVTFWLTRPKTARPWRTWVRTAPDVDKLARSTFDALTGIAFRDDALVVELTARKRYTDGPTGARITIAPLEDVEQQGYVLTSPEIGPAPRTWHPQLGETA